MSIAISKALVASVIQTFSERSELELKTEYRRKLDIANLNSVNSNSQLFQLKTSCFGFALQSFSTWHSVQCTDSRYFKVFLFSLRVLNKGIELCINRGVRYNKEDI